VDLTEHPLLSDDARGVGEKTLVAHVQVARVLLGLEGHSFQGGPLNTARSAIALQVNRQVQKALEPDVFLAASVNRGSRSKAYADAARNTLDPVAMNLVSTILPRGGQYGAPVRTLR
jgi:hypothetical protein